MTGHRVAAMGRKLSVLEERMGRAEVRSVRIPNRRAGEGVVRCEGVRDVIEVIRVSVFDKGAGGGDNGRGGEEGRSSSGSRVGTGGGDAGGDAGGEISRVICSRLVRRIEARSAMLIG